MPDFDFPAGQPICELAEWLTREKPADATAARLTVYRQPVGVEFLEGLAGEAFACLYARTIRGCRPSAEFLIKLLYGSLDRPFREKVEAMSLDQARNAVYELLISQGKNHQQAIHFIESLSSGSTIAEAAGLPAALPQETP